MRKLARDALACLIFVGCALPASASPLYSSPGYRSPFAKHPTVAKPVPGQKLVGAAARRAAPSRTPPAQAFLHGDRYERGSFLQCVTFARDASGIHLSGNAHAWWYNAAGRFARGQRPEPGAVLNFKASGGMRMGHVSVVRQVVSAREVLIDDANWAVPGQRKGMVRRGASVVDVSPANDWTEVRVANGIGSWGRVYPTYGFIYPRADRGFEPERIELAAERPAPVERAQPRRGTSAGATERGWVWSNGIATVPSGLAGTLQATSAATQSGSSSGSRWIWVDGQARAIR
jgi:surface antigen